jgi:hypothetical protein
MVYQGSPFSTPLPTFFISCHFGSSLPTGVGNITGVGFDLHFAEDY